jgi:hypothetical protein
MEGPTKDLDCERALLILDGIAPEHDNKKDNKKRIGGQFLGEWSSEDANFIQMHITHQLMSLAMHKSKDDNINK